MTDEKSKKDPKVKDTSPKEPAKEQKSVDSKQKSEAGSQKAEGNKQKTEKSSSAKATADKKATTDKKKKKSAEKKPSLTQKEIDALILENEDLKANFKKSNEDLLLLAAEFENFKKRINKEQVRSKELYKENMLGDLIPVIDDIDRALQHHSDDETSQVLTMVKNKLMTYLDTYDVKPFESIGQEFDPDKHDAMLTRAEEDKADNIILEEFEKGYMVGKKVLRHAKVIVNIIE